MASTTWPWTFAGNIMRTGTVQKRKLPSTSKSSRFSPCIQGSAALRRQSARALRRNFVNVSPDKRINPIEIRVVRRTVAKFRADLTLEQLGNYKIDDSFGSLVLYTDSKFFSSLVAEHNKLDSHFHFNLFELFVIGWDLNPKDDMVYITFSTIWHLLNFLRNIGAGWLLQVNGGATYNMCRRSVAMLSLGGTVNSIGHVNNPVCWAIIPESESKEIIQCTWRSVQVAAMMLMKKIKLCDDDDCGVCSCICDLLAMPLDVQFMNQPSFKEDKFDVDATLSDCCKGWTAATIEEFQIEANMCINHVTWIPAANYSQAKYYKSR
jgi:hypothetical protein